MNPEVRTRLVYSAAATMLTLTAWMVPAQAQAQPPAQTEYPLAIPNTGQQINPFAPAGSQFVWLNPGLTTLPNWYAGQAATSVVSPTIKRCWL